MAAQPPSDPDDPGSPVPKPLQPKLSLRARALQLLARRDHSRLELERKLAADNPDPDELAALLTELERRGWLSDSRLVEQKIARAQGRYGPRRVLTELKEKGVEGDMLERAGEKLRDAELENAREVWRKRFGKPPVDLKDRARQARFLQGRGFSADVIRRVLKLEVDD